MTIMAEPCRAYLRVLESAAPTAARSLASALGLPRRTAGEIVAVTAALVPAGLARHLRRRPRNPEAAAEVVRKFGRPADVKAPQLGITGRLERPRLSPRLGGLFGDAGPRIAAWVAARAGGDAETIGRGIAAVAPVVLGALGEAAESRALGDWLSVIPDRALTRPDHLLDPNEVTAEIYRRIRRRVRPLWVRVLGVDG